VTTTPNLANCPGVDRLLGCRSAIDLTLTSLCSRCRAARAAREAARRALGPATITDAASRPRVPLRGDPRPPYAGPEKVCRSENEPPRFKQKKGLR
jgi:hypothetical protein